MVQRKLPSKLGIQTDHVKSEKRLGSLGPSSPRYQDCKNRGADRRKKKMKKSRSFKVADFESLGSQTIKREVVPQPGKPPTTLDKKSSNRGSSESSPNYMKSTSSFDARKEQSQGSKTPQKMVSNNTKLGSVSPAHKQAKTLSRTSSLKLARTPSFKPARGSTKNCCSQVVLCGDVNPQRGTCSSTMKNSKFPTYLALSPGATESEGTSAMRVCPYNYCSLNGHHHPPLPPLECFLSARRRAVKTQKTVKLGCLSPRRAKRPSCDDGMKEVIIPETTLDEKPAILQREEENQMDFFVEIYVKGMEDGCGMNETAEKNDGGQVVESFSEENLDGGIEVISSKIEIAELLPEEESFSSSTTQEEEIPETLRTEFDEMDPETCDMEQWDDEFDNSAETNGENDLENGSSSSSSSSLIDEEFVSGHFDEIPADKELEQFFEEEGESSGAGFSDGSVDSEDQNLRMYDEIVSAPGEEEDDIETRIQLPGEEEDDIETRIQLSDKQSHQSKIVEEQNHSYKDFHEDFSDSEEQTPAALNKIIMAESSNADVNEMELEDSTISQPEETFPSSERNAAKTSFVCGKRHSIEEPLETPINPRIVRCKRGGEEWEEKVKEFNPKEPNYLAIEAEPEAEKVDLRHQMMDERKNAEEWMIDYALQQAVTKLAPARKRKVALLVEAFEKVIPVMPKYGSHPSHDQSPAFSNSRPPLQACS